MYGSIQVLSYKDNASCQDCCNQACCLRRCREMYHLLGICFAASFSADASAWTLPQIHSRMMSPLSGSPSSFIRRRPSSFITILCTEISMLQQRRHQRSPTSCAHTLLSVLQMWLSMPEKAFVEASVYVWFAYMAIHWFCKASLMNNCRTCLPWICQWDLKQNKCTFIQEAESLNSRTEKLKSMLKTDPQAKGILNADHSKDLTDWQFTSQLHGGLTFSCCSSLLLITRCFSPSSSSFRQKASWSSKLSSSPYMWFGCDDTLSYRHHNCHKTGSWSAKIHSCAEIRSKLKSECTPQKQEKQSLQTSTQGIERS